MLKSFKPIWLGLLVVILFLLAPTPKVWAQMGSIEGDVKDESGTPLVGALVTLDRKDIKGHYEVKTDKKGHYFHAGLPTQFYKVSLMVDGKLVFFLDNIKINFGEVTKVDLDLKKEKDRAAASQPKLTKEQQEAMAKQAEEMKKFGSMKSLFEKGMGLKDQADKLPPTDPGRTDLYTQAGEAFKQASELDAKQIAIFANLAECYRQLKQYPAAIEAYTKALELFAAKPNPVSEAAYHINMGIVYGQMDKLDLAQAEMQKAAELNPANAPKAFFNLGAMLENKGKSDDAATAYDKAITADPNYADAYYRKGICLTSKATTSADGKMMAAPGTIEAFQKYLELDPQGKFAAESKAMIDTFSLTVDTQFKTPPKGAKGDKGAKKK
jgi:tetratricopeptide (TPR) repeat protein